jgi:hypothetical protein
MVNPIKDFRLPGNLEQVNEQITFIRVPDTRCNGRIKSSGDITY